MVYHYKFGIIVPYFKRNFRQLILIVAAFFMLSVGLSGLMAKAVDSTVVVTPDSMATDFSDVMSDPTSWFFYNDENDTIDSALGSFVSGPSVPPLGSDSVQVSVVGTQRRNIATYQFANTALADITDLKFSTYNPSSGNGGSVNRSGYLHFNVSFDGTDTWQRRLVYVPNVNGSVVQDTWQEWDAINSGNALWTWSNYISNGNKWPDNNPNQYRTWSDLVSSFADIKIRETDSWLGIRVGEPYNDGYTENIDKFVFGTTDGIRTFDFESAYPVTGTITNPVADGDVVSGTVNLTAVYQDGDMENDNAVQWAVRSGTCAPGMSTVLGNVDGFTTASMWDGKDFSASFDTTTLPNGSYCFVFNPTDDANQVDVRATRTFTVNNVVVVPDTTRPEVTINDPTSGEVLSGMVQVMGTIVDENPKDHRVRVFDDMGDRVFNGAWIVDDGLNNQLADSFDSTDYPDGDYRIRLIARDESDNRRGRNVWVVFDNYVSNKQECKNGGWSRGTFEGQSFRNQGQCVSFFERNNHGNNHGHKKGHVLSRMRDFSDWCRRNR